MNGTISVTSRKDEGTSVEILIPEKKIDVTPVPVTGAEGMQQKFVSKKMRSGAEGMQQKFVSKKMRLGEKRDDA
jgi:hypothetical protein